ncbi:MAG: hypothetical protein ACREBR_00085 [bacterium]
MPIIPRASQAVQMTMCLENSHLWHNFRQFTLIHNVRVVGAGNKFVDNDASQWHRLLLTMRCGAPPQNAQGQMELSPEVIMHHPERGQLQQNLINYVYDESINRHY